MDQVLQVLLEGPPRMTSLQEKEAKWEITLEVGATAVIHLQDHKTKTRMDPEGEADLVLLLMKTMMIMNHFNDHNFKLKSLLVRSPKSGSTLLPTYLPT